eukprot:12580709-Alexandrium_andersonii.AAC.1
MGAHYEYSALAVCRSGLARRRLHARAPRTGPPTSGRSARSASGLLLASPGPPAYYWRRPDPRA